MTLAMRIKQARDEAGLSQAALGKACGVSRNAVSQWESGETRPASARLLKIAAVTGMDAEWLLAGRGNMGKTPPKGDEASMEDYHRTVAMSEFDAKVGAGGGTNIEDVHKVAEWQIPIAWARTELRGEAEDLMIVTVEGDSMMPTIGPGEKVIINHTMLTPSPGGIFALWDGLATVVKRIEYIPNSEPARIRIISDNERYDSYERSAEEIHIIGRVVCRLQRL